MTAIRETNRAKLLKALQDHPEGIDTQSLVRIAGSRFGGRLYELRKLGWQIKTVPIEGSENALYKLTGKKDLQPELNLQTGEILHLVGSLPNNWELHQVMG